MKTLLLASLVVTTVRPMAAQVSVMANARAELLGATPEIRATGMTLGLGFDLEQSSWSAGLAVRGSPQLMGGWGAEIMGRNSLRLQLSPRGSLRWETQGVAYRPGTRWSWETRSLVGPEYRIGNYQVGAAVGLMSFDYSGSQTTPGGVLRAGYRVAHFAFSAEVGRFRRIRVSGPPGLSDSINDSSSKAVFTGLGHGRLTGSWTHRAFELSGALVRRSLPVRSSPFGYEIGVGFRAADIAKFKLIVGRMPLSGSNYLPGGRQLSFGVDLAGRSPRQLIGLPRIPVDAPARFSADVGDDGTVVIRAVRPGARTVEVLGDFSDWNPVTLVRGAQANLWEVRLRIEPGTHLICIRVDGGSLLVPDGLTAVDDEFGGRAGVLVIPQSGSPDSQ